MMWDMLLHAAIASSFVGIDTHLEGAQGTLKPLKADVHVNVLSCYLISAETNNGVVWR